MFADSGSRLKIVILFFYEFLGKIYGVCEG